jgi:hypothetical protein
VSPRVFDEQREQQLRIVAVGLLLADSFGFDLRRIADPHFDTEFRQQPLELARISGGLHSHAHVDRPLLQFAIKLLGFPIAVVQSPPAVLSRLGIGKREVLIARVVIHAYNDQVFGSFLPSLWSSTTEVYLRLRSRHCYEIKWIAAVQ